MRDDKKMFYTKADAAEYLGVSHSTVERMLKSGELPHYKFAAGSVRISREAIAELLNKAKANTTTITNKE